MVVALGTGLPVGEVSNNRFCFAGVVFPASCIGLFLSWTHVFSCLCAPFSPCPAWLGSGVSWRLCGQHILVLSSLSEKVVMGQVWLQNARLNLLLCSCYPEAAAFSLCWVVFPGEPVVKVVL